MPKPKNNESEAIFKHDVRELWGQFKGITAFVVGNGISKIFYDIDVLKKRGMILACNRSFEDHYVDILTFNDIQFNHIVKCLRFPGKFIVPMIGYGNKFTEILKPRMDDIYYFTYVNEIKDQNGLRYKNSGLTMAEAAYKMGFNPIILVGFDCCAERDKDGILRGNTHKENRELLNVMHKNKFTSLVFLRFKDEMMKFYKNPANTSANMQ